MWRFSDNIRKEKEDYDRQITALLQEIEDSKFYLKLQKCFASGIEYHVTIMKERIDGLVEYIKNSDEIVQIVCSEASKRGFCVYNDKIDEWWFDDESHKVGWRTNFAELGYAPLGNMIKVEALTVALANSFPIYQTKNRIVSQTYSCRSIPDREKLKELKEKQKNDPTHFFVKNNGGLYLFSEQTCCLLIPTIDYIEKTVVNLLNDRLSRMKQKESDLEQPF